jgi:gamma-glutamylcyclotransferase (GGCT)/AIG2-like uncharacterized protein YtfP
MDSAVRYLFVYGTLMTGMGASGMLRGIARPAGSATMQGRLYDLGEYPAAIASTQPSDTVCGELYELLSAAALREIDRYECCGPSAPHPLFTRETVAVRTAAGETVAAWAYFYARPLPATARPIPSGDYRLSRAGASA